MNDYCTDLHLGKQGMVNKTSYIQANLGTDLPLGIPKMAYKATSNDERTGLRLGVPLTRIMDGLGWLMD